MQLKDGGWTIKTIPLDMKKILIKVGFIFLTMTLVSTVVHAVVMPQVTRCLLIGFYDFKNNGNLYYRAKADSTEVLKITSLLEKANERNALFWGDNEAEPIFIYCDTDEDYKRFGSPLMTPAAAHLSSKSFVVISKD